MAQVSSYVCVHVFFSQAQLDRLVAHEPHWVKKLARRYVRWESLYRRLSLSGQCSYDRLAGLREKVELMYLELADALYGPYPPSSYSTCSLPCSFERWEQDQKGMRAKVRHERRLTLMADLKRCRERLVQSGAYGWEDFCPSCGHLLTPEEEFECACCQAHFDRDYEEDFE